MSKSDTSDCSNAPVLNLQLGSDSIIYWSSTSKHDHCEYSVQQYRWDKWVDIGEKVKAISFSAFSIFYRCQFDPKYYYHFGTNLFRIGVYHFESFIAIDSISIDSKGPYIERIGALHERPVFNLNDSTYYEIHDAYGKLMRRGFDSNIRIDNLPKGAYYLYFDNRHEKFIRP